MNKFLPNEVKNLSDNKERVIQNVMNRIETQQTKQIKNWQFGLVAVLLATVVVFFVIGQIPADTQQTTSEIVIEHPIFTEENGKYYLYGVTLNDSKSTVIEKLGENYKEDPDTGNSGTGADSILVFEELKVHFFEDKVILLEIQKMNENSFDEIFDQYQGEKFISPGYENDKYNIGYSRYLYSKESSQAIMAKYDPEKNLYVFLTPISDNFYEEAGVEKVTK